jgi:hypothetical protein
MNKIVIEKAKNGLASRLFGCRVVRALYVYLPRLVDQNLLT